MTRSLITHATSDFLAARQREEVLLILHELQEKAERNHQEIFTSEKISELLQRRDRHDIIADILKTAKEGKRKTYIMYKARLSHSQLKLYLELLNRSGMIIYSDGVYRTTPKGLTFVREFESINFLFRQ